MPVTATASTAIIGYGVGGSAPKHPSAKPSDGSSPVGRRGLEDVVSLSPEAAKALNERPFSIPIPPKGDTGASSDPVAVEMENRLAYGQFNLQRGEYVRQSFELLRQTLKLPEDQPLVLADAASVFLDKVAAKNGLSKPELPEKLRAAGFKDPFEENAKSGAGMIGIGMPNSTNTLQIAFDLSGLEALTSASPSGKPEKPLRMVALNDRDGRTAPLLGAVKGGALGRYTDTRPGQGASLWAVTDGGDGPSAPLLASVRSVGMDDVAAEVATGLLKGLKDLFAKA